MKAFLGAVALISISQLVFAETAKVQSTDANVKNQCLMQVAAIVTTVGDNQEAVAEAKKSKKQKVPSRQYVLSQQADQKLSELWKKVIPVVENVKKTGTKTASDEKNIAEFLSLSENLLKKDGGTELQDCAAMTTTILEETMKVCPGFEKMDQAGSAAKACLDSAKKSPRVVAAIQQWSKFMGKAQSLIQDPATVQ